MTGRIRVNTEELRRVAAELELIAPALRDLGSRVQSSTLLETFDPRYAAQLSGQVQPEGAYAGSEANLCAEQHEGFSQRLLEIARRFEEADLATSQDMEALYRVLQAAIAAQEETAFAPGWLLRGGIPPWVERWDWLDMSEEDRQQQLEYYRQEWAKFQAGRTAGSFREPQQDTAYLEEMFKIYLYGLPAALFDPRTGKQTEPYDPDHELSDKPALPDGTSTYLNDAGQNRFTKYQYQDLTDYYERLRSRGMLEKLGLGELPEGVDPEEWSRAHHNLCGLDAVGQATGAEDMFQTYVAYAGEDQAMLVNGETMSPNEVRNLYRELGWESEHISRFKGSEVHWSDSNPAAYPTFGQVEEKLGQGYVITALVGVDKGTGFLSAAESSTGHFVNIVETMETRDGTELVRVYNSMHHREEVYTWGQFDAVWRQAGGNSGGQGVIAKPPAPDG